MAEKSEGEGRPRRDLSARNRAGGEAVKAKYGTEHFREMGRKGGEVRRERGTDFHELGQRGGNTTKARQSSDYYSVIGRAGGKAGKGIPRRRSKGTGSPEEKGR